MECCEVTSLRFRDKDFIREFSSLFTSLINVMCASCPDPKVLLFPEVFNML